MMPVRPQHDRNYIDLACRPGIGSCPSSFSLTVGVSVGVSRSSASPRTLRTPLTKFHLQTHQHQYPFAASLIVKLKLIKIVKRTQSGAMADASPPEDAQISKTDEKKPTTRRRRRAVSFDGAGFELRGGEDCGSCDSKVYVTDDGGLIIAPSRKRGGSSKGKSSASSPTTKPPAGEGSRTHSHDTKRASSQGRHTTKSIDQVVATFYD